MAKQLNVNLAFNAETAQARKAIEDLSQSLRKIQVQPSRMFDDTDLKKASQAAQDLEKHLRAAVNVDTGKLDLNKFSQSLASSKQNLGDLYKDLSRAGAEGQTAFLNLAKSINAADSSTLNLGSKLRELSTTLKNTARWEISSKIMHGFESAISSAYGYAQDLNKSLTDIRIVTGANADEMARFAENANKAAKSLSTTTTDYTNASLIYFQQGLSDQEVAERTEVTIKMANAAGVSAQKVSDQMTAVWNNFDDGSKSLEYYADVMTALGAATASSTDEISQGLNKFAAVAETVGLSYEYATAALATVTSETRESADVVGTAYKTLFARIQGLQQGETLDDGTSLNKYSAALAKVGIDIKDVNGDMKDMDTILNEMGAKWGTLAKDQQLALAQTVAGVRQYTQLVALMDNWGTFQENLNTAYNAEGSLQEQADIYAESWEAASKRVEAAAQGIYQELLNDDFFIDILNGFEGFLTGINNVIDGVGGLKTILLSVGGIFLKQYAKEIPSALSSLSSNFDVLTGKAEKNRQKMLQDNANALAQVDVDPLSKSAKTEITTMQKVSQMTVALEKNIKNLSDAEIAEYRHKIEMLKLYGESATAIAKEREELEKLISAKEREAIQNADDNFMNRINATESEIEKIQERQKVADEAVETSRKAMENAPADKKENAEKEYNKALAQQKTLTDQLARATEKLNNLQEFGGSSGAKSMMDQYKKQVNTQQELLSIRQKLKNQTFSWAEEFKGLEEGSQDLIDFNKKLEEYAQIIRELSSGKVNFSVEDIQQLLKDLNATKGTTQELNTVFQAWAEKSGSAVKELDTQIEALDDDISGTEQVLSDIGVKASVYTTVKDGIIGVREASEEGAYYTGEMNKAFTDNITHSVTLSESYGIMASTLMEVWGAIESIKNLGSIWSDDDLSTGEKMFQTISAMLPIIISLTSALGQQNRNQLASAAASISQAIGLKTAAVAEVAAAGATNTLNVSLGTLWGLLRPIALILGAVALAVWGLVEAFAAAKAASPEGRLEAAKNEAKELKTALDDAKAAAEDLNSSFDSYDSAVEALENCTKGTQEWRDALQNVNNEVLDLLSKYPELASYISYGDSGEMVISEEGRNYLQDQSNQRVRTAQAASTAANQQVREAQIVVDTKDLASQINQVSGTTAYKTDYQGNIIDYSSMVASYIAQHAKELSGMKPEDQAKMIQSYLDSSGIVADTQAWVDAITELGPEIGQLVSSIDANTAATKVENQTIAANALANNDTVQNSEYVNDIIAASGDIYGQLYEKEMAALDQWGKAGISKATGVNQEAKDVWNKYLTAAGLSAKDNRLVDTTGTDNNREFIYKDAEGEEKSITLEAMKEIVASANAIDALGGSAQELTQLFTQLSTSGDAADKALQGLIAADDFANATRKEAEALRDAVDTNGDGATQEEALTYLNEKFGEDYDYTKLGYESAEAMAQAIADGINNIDDEWNDVGSHLSGKAKDAFDKAMDSGIFDDLSLSQTEQVADMFNEAFKNGGRNASVALGEVLDPLFENAGEDAGELANILNSVDWQTTNVEDLKAQLEAAGIATDGFEDELQQLINLMTTEDPLGFDKAAEKYASLHEIVDGLEKGDTISAEDMATLEAAGINVNDYFALMADGSGKLRGDAEEFYNLVNSMALGEFEQNIGALQEDNTRIDNLLESHAQASIQNENTNYEGGGRRSVNTDQVSDQIDYLASLGTNATGISEEKMAEWQDALEAGDLTVRQAREIQQATEDNAAAWGNLTSIQAENSEELARNQEALANSCTTMDQLNTLLDRGIVSEEAYAKAVEMVGAAEAEAHGLDPEAFEELSEMIEESGSAIEGLSDDLKGNEREANDVAKAIMRYDKAVESVNENSEDWMKTLKSGNLQDQAAIMDDLAEAYGNMMDIDGSQLSDSFLQSAENLELMQKAAAGSEEAYDALMLKMQEDIIAQCDLDTTKFDAAKAALDAELAALNFETLEIGANLNTDAALAAMTDLVNAAGMTAEQATAYLASMGVDAEVVEEPNVTTDTVEYQGSDSSLKPNYAVAKYPSFFGSTYRTMVTYDEVVTPTAVTETVEKENTAVALKVTSANKSSGGNFKHSNSSSGSGTKKKKSGGGGGSSKKTPTPAKQQKVSSESDVVDRYHTTNEKLDDLSKALDKSARAADRLWSKERLKYLDEQNELLQDEIDLLEAKRQEAQDYLAEDTSALEAAAAKAGFSVTYDENGVITNYRSMMEALADQLIAAENQMNTFATQEEQDAYEQTVLEPLRKKIEELEAAIAMYEETLGILEDTDKEIETKQDQIMQNNYDKIMGTLKINIEVNDRDLELLDYYLSKIEDDFYSAAEAAALMVGQLDTSSTMGGQMGEYFQQLKEYSNALDELNAKHAAGEITDAAYEEGLEEIRSGLLDNLEAIQELDQAMLEYYSNTLSMANEEIDKYVKRMEHQTSILEHYGNIMEILGKEMDYESMGEILQGQVDTIENEMEVAEATYNMYQQQADEKKALLDDAIARGDMAAAEVYQAEWEAANEAAMEAQSDMLDKTEEWAEAMRAVVENKLAGLAKSLEEALTGGTSFDEMTTSIERAASLQEEYLTTTNQIYETNKLMRQAQQEIDKTNNTVAKQRLKDFIVETDQLQEKSKLSQYELEIQQAKYNLLLAEIALEEAQNAKSTVRLQRDSEGNFGYVYTADQDQVSQAQQELEDAQNSLYNIALEGANDYTEKYSETLQEMYDTLTSIQEAWLNGEIATQEEYDRQMLAAQEYYYQKLEDYSSLYTVAVTTDTRVVKDAWSSGFSDMIYKTETWKEAVNTYSNEAKQTLVDWYAKVDEIANKTGLDNIAGKVKAITDESEALKTALLGEDGKSGVIQAIKDELTAVSNLTGGYADLRSTIQGLIADYEKMMKTINNAQNQQTDAQHDASTGSGGTSGDTDIPSPSEESTPPDSGSSGNTAPSGTGNGTPTIAVGQTVTVKTSATHFSRDGGNGTRMRSFVPGSTYSVMDYDDDEVQIGKNGIVTGWIKKTDIVGFNTGGYTGEWGPYGKLAFLDEKELILNEGDTANFLASMELLSHILEIIDLQSATAQLGGLLTTPSYAGAMNEIIEQNVHIEASFPAVQDRNEIEEAFNTLINRASQYANRK